MAHQFQHDAEIVVSQVLNGGFSQLWGNYGQRRGYNVPVMLARAAEFFEEKGASEIAEIFRGAEGINGKIEIERDRWGNLPEDEYETEYEYDRDRINAQFDPLEDKFYGMWESNFENKPGVEGSWEKYFENEPKDSPIFRQMQEMKHQSSDKAASYKKKAKKAGKVVTPWHSLSPNSFTAELARVANRIAKRASVKKADMPHSDDEVLKNAEPAAEPPELAGGLERPEAGNATAMRDAIETQVEYEVGKPIVQKELELKTPGGDIRPEVAEEVKKFPNVPPTPMGEGAAGKQIIINIANQTVNKVLAAVTPTGNDTDAVTSGHGGMGGTDVNVVTPKVGAKPMPQKGDPEWHRLRIAIQTLKMNDPMAAVMGGPSKDEARKTLMEYGINPARYDKPDTSPITGKKSAWTMPCPQCKGTATKSDPSGDFSCKNCGWHSRPLGMQLQQDPKPARALASQKKAEDVGPDVAQAAAEVDANKKDLAATADPMSVVPPVEFKDKEIVHKGKTAGIAFTCPECQKEIYQPLARQKVYRHLLTHGLPDEEAQEEAMKIPVGKTAMVGSNEPVKVYDKTAGGFPALGQDDPNARCMKCHQQIQPGQPVNWEGPGGAEAHISCPAPRAAAKRAANRFQYYFPAQVLAQFYPELAKAAGFNFFFPGQALREFRPELQHEIVDYPNATNSPMLSPEIVGDGGHNLEEAQIEDAGLFEPERTDEMGRLEAAVEGAMEEIPIVGYVSTSPSGALGIGRDGKPQTMEGVPLRKENDIRGYMFYDEFYGKQDAVPASAFTANDPSGATKDDHKGGAGQMFMDEYHQQYEGGPALASLNKKVAAADEAGQFAIFLKKVMGEIAAAMIAAFKATSRPLLDKIPGYGEVQLAQIEEPSLHHLYNVFNTPNAGSRVKYLLEHLNDDMIKAAINDAWAQAAVWCESDKGGFTYEVYVRPQSIDTDTMIMKYEFIAGTKE